MMRDTHQRFGPSIIDAYTFAETRGGMEGPDGRGGVSCGLPDGRWVPARPLGGWGRWRAAWLVFTGRADALVWPGQGDQ